MRKRQSKPLLDDRDKEILSWMVKGKTCKEIAAIIYAGKGTVEHRLLMMRERLGCSNKAELIATFMNLSKVSESTEISEKANDSEKTRV